MAIRKLPDLDLLRQLFSYNAASGEIVLLARPSAFFAADRDCRAWNTRNAGIKVSARKSGYPAVGVQGVRYLAHRVAYKMHYGVEPPPELDHINGDRNDIRIANIRAVTRSQNMMNTPPRVKSTTGARGIYIHQGKFCARITANGKTLHLGRFSTLSEAVQARKAAEIEVHGKYAHARIRDSATN